MDKVVAITIQKDSFVKSEPRFTIEESYNRLREKAKDKKEAVKKEPSKTAISEGLHLVKTLEKIDLSKMKKKQGSTIHHYH